jgi:hypothetical protein
MNLSVINMQLCSGIILAEEYLLDSIYEKNSTGERNDRSKSCLWIISDANRATMLQDLLMFKKRILNTVQELEISCCFSPDFT